MFPFKITKEIKSRLENDFYTYLEKENILPELMKLSVDYLKMASSYARRSEFFPPFRYLLSLDLLQLQTISDDAFHLFILDPALGQDLARFVVFCVVSFFSGMKNLEISDIDLNFSIASVPTVACLCTLESATGSGLVLLRGILIARTTPKKYIKSSIFLCPLDSCTNRTGRRYSELVSYCENCCCPLVEDYPSRDLGDEIVCLFICNNSCQLQGISQPITIKARDHVSTSTSLELGGEYNILCKREGPSFLAWCISEKVASCEALMREPEPYPVPIPDPVARLYMDVRKLSPSSPWIFALAVSSQIGSDVFPMSSFSHLKRGLSLSLASQKTNNCPVPIIAIGGDSFAAQKLFDKAGSLAERYVTYTLAPHLGGSLVEGDEPGTIWQEGGPIIMAMDGVCNLGDCSKFKKHQADYIHQTIESGNIVFNNCTNVKNTIYSKRLRCAVWMYWCHIAVKKCDQLQLKILLDVFGMPFLTDEVDDSEIKKVCDKLLHGKSKKQAIPTEDLKEFFLLVNSRTPDFTESATELIKNYFVASRKDRPGCLPLSSLEIMRRMSEAHARLSLRMEVLPEDAIAVIYLYEESISSLFGESNFGVFRKLNRNNDDSYLIHMDKQLMAFQKWLEEYLGNLV